MTKIKSEHFTVAMFLSAVTASALTMLWLLWHFPIATFTTALILLAGMTFVARLAKTLDTEPPGEDRHPEASA